MNFTIAMLKVRDAFAELDLEPPKSIILKNAEQGRRFKQLIGPEVNFQVLEGDQRVYKGADRVLWFEIEVCGIKIRWPR